MNEIIYLHTVITSLPFIIAFINIAFINIALVALGLK